MRIHVSARSITWLTLVLASVVSGCGQSDREVEQAVSVVAGSPLEVAAVPAVVVGSADGDSTQILYGVTHPMRLGAELVIPMADGRIQVHDEAGQLVRTMGGSGEGPGEFSWLSSAWLRGDTIEAYDPQLRRITRFLPDSTIETVPLEPVALMPSAKGRVSRGYILASVANSGGDRGPRSRDTLLLHHHGLNGGHTADIFRIAGMGRYSNAEWRDVPEPLAPTARVRTHDGHIYAGQTLDPVITVLDDAGNVLRELTWVVDPPGPSPDRAFALVRDSVLALAAPDELAEEKARLDAAPAPDRLSAWWDFLVDELGFVWIRPYEVSRHAHDLGGWRGAGPGGEWIVLSPEGERVGMVRLPPDLELKQITADAVVGISRDELGVERVQVHALERAAVERIHGELRGAP